MSSGQPIHNLSRRRNHHAPEQRPARIGPVFLYAEGMEENDRSRQLSDQWNEINRQLEELAAGRAIPANADPKLRERALLAKLDEIEYELGMMDRGKSEHERDDRTR